MRKLTEIIVHTAAVRPDWMAGRTVDDKVKEIRLWHTRDNGWSDIGYHYVIDRDGTVGTGRPLAKAGAHTRGRNSNTVGVCLVGGRGGSENDNFSDHYTKAQEVALRNLISSLKQTYPSIKTVSGHNQYAAKACPCFNVPNWYADKPNRTFKLQSSTIQAGSLATGGIVTAAGTAVGGLSENAQLIVVGALCIAGLAVLYMMKERFKKWDSGRH